MVSCAYEAEPGKLAEVRPLPAHLEVFPTALSILLGEGIVAKSVFFVVLIEEILDDGGGLHVSVMPTICDSGTCQIT